jgi:hypothetical protein
MSRIRRLFLVVLVSCSLATAVGAGALAAEAPVTTVAAGSPTGLKPPPKDHCPSNTMW